MSLLLFRHNKNNDDDRDDDDDDDEDDGCSYNKLFNQWLLSSLWCFLIRDTYSASRIYPI